MNPPDEAVSAASPGHADRREPIAADWSYHYLCSRTLGWVAAVYGTLCLTVVPYLKYHYGYVLSDYSRAILLGVWTLGVPAYFLIEWAYLVPRGIDIDSKEIKEFKEGREVAKNFWLAVGTMMTLVFFGSQLLKNEPADSKDGDTERSRTHITVKGSTRGTELR